MLGAVPPHSRSFCYVSLNEAQSQLSAGNYHVRKTIEGKSASQAHPRTYPFFSRSTSWTRDQICVCDVWETSAHLRVTYLLPGFWSPPYCRSDATDVRRPSHCHTFRPDLLLETQCSGSSPVGVLGRGCRNSSWTWRVGIHKAMTAWTLLPSGREIGRHRELLSFV